MPARNFVKEFESWEKSPLLYCSCDECMNSDPDDAIRDCPQCGMAFCYDCAQDHECDEESDQADYEDDDEWDDEDEDSDDDDDSDNDDDSDDEDEEE